MGLGPVRSLPLSVSAGNSLSREKGPLKPLGAVHVLKICSLVTKDLSKIKPNKQLSSIGLILKFKINQDIVGKHETSVIVMLMVELLRFGYVTLQF